VKQDGTKDVKQDTTKEVKATKDVKQDATKDVKQDATTPFSSSSRPRQLLAPELKYIAAHTKDIWRDEHMLQKVESLLKQKGDILFVQRDGIVPILVAKSVVYPVCLQGSNRSQVLYWLFEKLRSEIGPVEIQLPHGAETGNDPHVAYRDLNGDNWMQYICDGPVDSAPSEKSDPIHLPFIDAFKCRKKPKAGQDYLKQQKLKLNQDDYCGIPFSVLAEHRTKARMWFDLNYYGPATRETRNRQHIFFCFERAAPIVIGRLLEQLTSDSKHSTKADLSHVTIVSLPFEDEAATAMKTSRALLVNRNNVTRDQLVTETFLKMKETYRQCIAIPPKPRRRRC